MIIPFVGHVSEPQEEDKLQTPVTLTQGSQEEEAVMNKDYIVNIKSANVKSYENEVDNANIGDQDRLDKDRSYENLLDNTNVSDQEMLNKDYFEKSPDNDSACPREPRPRK